MAGTGVQAGKKQQPVYLQRPWGYRYAGAVDRRRRVADEVLYYHTGRKRRAGGDDGRRGNIVRGSGLLRMGT